MSEPKRIHFWKGGSLDDQTVERTLCQAYRIADLAGEGEDWIDALDAVTCAGCFQAAKNICERVSPRPLTGPIPRVEFYRHRLGAGACTKGPTVKFFVFYASNEGLELKEFDTERQTLEFIQEELKGSMIYDQSTSRDRPFRLEDFKVVSGHVLKLIAQEKIVAVAFDRR